MQGSAISTGGRPRRTIARSAVLFGALLAAAPVRAQTQTQTDAPREEARQHFLRAITLVDESRWLDAIPELEAARDLAVTSAVLFNLGLAQRAVGRLRASIVTFTEFLRLVGDDVNPARRQEVDGYLTELAAALGHLDLQVEPVGATVTVDGQPAARTADVEVDPGVHLVSADARGFEHAERRVEIRSGQRAQVSLRLTPAQLLGHLRVDTNVPDSRIEVDRGYVGANSADADLPVGRHTIRVSATGYQPFTEEVVLAAGGTTRIRARLQSSRGILTSPWLWTGVGLGVAALTVGAVLLLSGTEDPVRPVWGVSTTYIQTGPRP